MVLLQRIMVDLWMQVPMTVSHVTQFKARPGQPVSVQPKLLSIRMHVMPGRQRYHRSLRLLEHVIRASAFVYLEA